MKLSYHRATDSLYIELLERAGVDSLEVADGVVLDFDAAGNVVGIDIENARTKVQLDRLVLGQIDAAIETVAEESDPTL